MARLADLAALAGQRLSGSVTADLHLDAGAARLQAEAHDAGLPSARLRRLAVTAHVADPTTRPVVTAQLAAEGIEAGDSGRLGQGGPVRSAGGVGGAGRPRRCG